MDTLNLWTRLISLHHSEIALRHSEIVKRGLKCRCASTLEHWKERKEWKEYKDPNSGRPYYHQPTSTTRWPPCNIMHGYDEPRTVFLFNIKVFPKQNLFCVVVASAAPSAKRMHRTCHHLAANDAHARKHCRILLCIGVYHSNMSCLMSLLSIWCFADALYTCMQLREDVFPTAIIGNPIALDTSRNDPPSHVARSAEEDRLHWLILDLQAEKDAEKAERKRISSALTFSHKREKYCQEENKMLKGEIKAGKESLAKLAGRDLELMSMKDLEALQEEQTQGQERVAQCMLERMPCSNCGYYDAIHLCQGHVFGEKESAVALSYDDLFDLYHAAPACMERLCKGCMAILDLQIPIIYSDNEFTGLRDKIVDDVKYHNDLLLQRAQDRALAFVMSQHKRLGTKCSAGFQMIHHSDLLRRILTLSNPSEGTLTWQLCGLCDEDLMCSSSAHDLPIDFDPIDPAYMTCRHCIENMWDSEM